MPRKPAKLVQLHHDYQHVFGSESGKRVLYDMMSAGHMLHTSFVEGNQHASAFREGERNFVLRIMAILNQDPKQLEQMIKQREESNHE